MRGPGWIFLIALTVQVAAQPTMPPGLSPTVSVTEAAAFSEPETELTRLMVGQQAGVVKVLGPNRQGVALNRCLDDKNQAPLTKQNCSDIFRALGLPTQRLSSVVRDILSNYAHMPRKEAVAFLGVAVCSSSVSSNLSDDVEKFLVSLLETETDVHARRQALLSLAVKPTVSKSTTEKVLALYERSDNLWETFPIQQYFQYHSQQLRKTAQFGELRQRVAAVNSLYTSAILEYLDGP